MCLRRPFYIYRKVCYNHALSERVFPFCGRDVINGKKCSYLEGKIMAVAALVLGIIGLVTSFWGSFASFLLSVLAIIFGAISKRKTGLKKAKAGFVLGIIGVVVVLVVGVFSPALLKEGEKARQERAAIEADRAETERKIAEMEAGIPSNDNLTISKPTEKPQSAVSGISVTNFTYQGMSVSYTGAQITSNYEGKQCVEIYFTFSNNSTDNQNFGMNFNAQAFQNGIEMESTFSMSDENESIFTDIQPGASISVSKAVLTEDFDNPIDVEVSPYTALNGEKLAKFTINFQ